MIAARKVGALFEVVRVQRRAGAVKVCHAEPGVVRRTGQKGDCFFKRIAELHQKSAPDLLNRCDIKENIDALERIVVKLLLPLLLAEERHGVGKRAVVVGVSDFKRCCKLLRFAYFRQWGGHYGVASDLRYVYAAVIFIVVVKTGGGGRAAVCPDKDFAVRGIGKLKKLPVRVFNRKSKAFAVCFADCPCNKGGKLLFGILFCNFNIVFAFFKVFGKNNVGFFRLVSAFPAEKLNASDCCV